MASKTVRFYFDFLSPYSYLASQLLATRPEYRSIELDIRPVVFGTVLSRLDSKGQGEIKAQRRIGLEDVILLAKLHGFPLEGPPTHPFNSIYALRSVCGVADPAKRRELTRLYFLRTWGEGKSLEDMDVLKGCLREVGVEQDPMEAASARENRQALKSYTEELLELGGWGVPFLVVDDIALFGHDRLPLLRALLDGKVAPDRAKLESLLARPQPGRIT